MAGQMADRASQHAVVMERVIRTAGGEDGPARLLDGVDLAVGRGAWVNLVGPSGSGKSTLLRLINRMDPASSGRIEVFGRAIERWDVRELRQRVAMVFQEPTLLDRTVRENLRLPLQWGGPGKPGAVDGEAILALVGLDGSLLDRHEDQLSVGQRQRIGLARALVTEPAILLLDEPTAALDVRSAEQLIQTIRAIQQRRDLTVLMATHRLDEARDDGAELVVMIDGRIAARGAAQALFDDPPAGPVHRFLKGDPS